MTRRKVTIQTHFTRLEVTPIPLEYPGFGIFDTAGLDPTKSYRVLATTLHRYKDGSIEPVFILEGEDRHIIEKACVRFKVATIE